MLLALTWQQLLPGQTTRLCSVNRLSAFVPLSRHFVASLASRVTDGVSQSSVPVSPSMIQASGLARILKIAPGRGLRVRAADGGAIFDLAQGSEQTPARAATHSSAPASIRA